MCAVIQEVILWLICRVQVGGSPSLIGGDCLFSLQLLWLSPLVMGVNCDMCNSPGRDALCTQLVQD